MATKRRASNLLALAVLSLLAERPTHPYEMDFLMRTRGIAESIKLNRGSLYTVVESLQRDELIVPLETQREGRRPERTVYALTEAGRAKFNGWHRELMRRPIKEYPQFAAALAFLAHLSPVEVVTLLEERAARLDAAVEERRFRLVAIRERLNVPRLFLMEEEFSVSQQEAELAWVRAIIADIADGTLAWPDFGATRTVPVWDNAADSPTVDGDAAGEGSDA